MLLICLHLPWLPGKAESRPKPSRKRPRSAMRRGKHCETKSTKCVEATAATGTARLIFAKAQNLQSLADRQSELKATDASNTSNTSNGLVAVSKEAKVILVGRKALQLYHQLKQLSPQMGSQRSKTEMVRKIPTQGYRVQVLNPMKPQSLHSPRNRSVGLMGLPS